MSGESMDLFFEQRQLSYVVMTPNMDILFSLKKFMKCLSENLSSPRYPFIHGSTPGFLSYCIQNVSSFITLLSIESKSRNPSGEFFKCTISPSILIFCCPYKIEVIGRIKININKNLFICPSELQHLISSQNLLKRTPRTVYFFQVRIFLQS